MNSFNDFPQPHAKALERHRLLSDVILQQMQPQGGYLSFADYMALALYHPQWGYYSRDDMAFGREGDFTTAPEISPLFARCFAKPCLQISEKLGTHDLLELGAGSGRFASELLKELAQHQALPSHYYIVEISPGLRKKQQEFLQSTCPQFYSRLVWLETLPTPFKGCIIANEVLDALPVHCFSVRDQDIAERCVASNNQQFVWQLTSPTTPILTEKVYALRQQYDLTPGYTSEINLGLEAFIQSLADCLSQGIILLVDYGYGQRDYYHPLRHQGTLSCFYQHRVHDNPFLLTGLQDITAHVDFTRVIESAAASGCSLLGYTSQAAFLLATGLTSLVQQAELTLSEIEKIQLHQAIKTLTLPSEMGERVQVMALDKNLDMPTLLGFDLQDKRRDL